MSLAVKNLREEVKKAHPLIVFLMETKQQSSFMERKRRLVNYEEAWYVEPEGKLGGLTLWWHDNIRVNVISSSRNLIHTLVETDDQCLYISFIYGPPIEGDRMRVWNQIRTIATSMVDSWLCVGDFNDLISQSEKMGGNPRIFRRILNFQSFVSDCGLSDLEAKGARYTWYNQRLGDTHIKEKIDKAMGNLLMRDEFPKALIIHKEPLASDHHILLVLLNYTGIKTPKAFKFEVNWATNPEFKELMHDCWLHIVAEPSNGIQAIIWRLDRCRNILMEWSKGAFPNNQKRASYLIKKIEGLKAGVYTAEIVQDVALLNKEVEELWHREEVY